MTVRRRADRRGRPGVVRFEERLSVPPWWWLVGAGVVALVVFSVRLGHPGVPAWLPAVLVGGTVALALTRLSGTRVSVTEEAGETTLRVGPAVLARRFVAEVSVVAPVDKQRVLGPELHPHAFVLHRPWIGPAVRVRLDDPDDPTPYWVISVRRPEALVRQLGAADPH